ncbi:MAG: UvrD-helicase domain-containing protein, partial [Planctomycetes bacterium]|nr:UvrD-helicase domain-containing protein [Planctomycetota bacterium]
MDLFQDLTEAQAQAVRHKDGPLLVLAGAGSGKTRVVTRRMANLVREGVKPWSILGITFTNKAAGEMRERVKQLAAEDVWVSTFHSFCARMLRRHLDLEPYTREFSIFDQDDSKRLVEDVLEELRIDDKQNKPASIQASISRFKNAMARPEDVSASASSFGARVVAQAFERYQARLQASNALDFDDLLL